MPTLIQVKAFNNAGTGTSASATLDAPTTPGNCLIVLAADTASTTNGDISGVTLGGSADNFGSLVTFGNGSDHADGAAWADPNCAGGQTAVAVSTTGSSGTVNLFGWVFEFSGMPATLGALLDQSATVSSAGFVSSWTLGPTGTTAQASQVWLGIVCGNSSGTPGLTGPSSPWNNQAEQSNGARTALAGYQIVSSTGTASYSGTASPTNTISGLVLTVNAAADAAANPAAQPAQPGRAWLRRFKHRQTAAVPSAASTVQVNLTDSGAGTDSLAVAADVPLADSGTGTDALAITQPTSLSDAGAGADALAITQPTGLTDAGTGTDSLAIVQPAGLTDSGSSAEALGIMPGLTDSGTGTDALSITLASAIPLTDAGSASDQLGIMPGLADSGTGADSLAVASAVPLSDAGTGADVFAVTQPTGLADTGRGTDSLAIVPVTPGQAPGLVTAANGLAQSVKAASSAASVRAANSAAQLVRAGNSI